MNYSTLKKTVVLSFVSLMAVGMANAQTATDTSKMSSATGTAKVFGGASQYRTWSVGINVGVVSNQAAFLNNSTSSFKAEIGYGAQLKDQLTHSLAVQLNYYGGTVEGSSDKAFNGPSFFQTKFNSVSVSGVIDIGSISFLHRQSGIILYATAGLGIDLYKVNYSITPGATSGDLAFAGGKNLGELFAPLGTGIKFKLSDALDLDLGYNINFVDNYNFSNGAAKQWPQLTSHYGYTYAGLDYTFGSKAKPSLEWANPVAMMYDELYDEALRQEVKALEGRVGNVETAINDFKKDSDGDGVADQFDKCPNTPAGTVVDGSGCPIVFPKLDTAAVCKACAAMGMAKSEMTGAAYSNIQFEFDSSVLKTSSYPILDATSADLRTGGSSCELDGFASSEGTAAHNMRLSKDRANSVKTYLVNSGVPAKKLKIKGYGETHPVADNSTEAGRILNRRVEFHKK